MADAKKCDICGEYFEIIDGDINQFCMQHSNGRGGTCKYTFVDICSKCVKAFNDLRESLKENKPLKPSTLDNQLTAVNRDGVIYFHDKSDGRYYSEPCIVCVIMDVENKRVQKIHSVIAGMWIYRCESDAMLQTTVDMKGNNEYTHFDVKYEWYKKHVTSESRYGEWTPAPTVSHIEYNI